MNKYPDSAKVAIILCVKNGEPFLADQLDSIKKQTFKDIDIYISYNSSSDNSHAEIKKFKRSNPNLKINISIGKDLHFAKNFLKLSKDIKKSYEYYAFCDQDDVWLPNHLKRGINYLEQKERGIACIFCSRTILIDDKNNVIGKSMRFSKEPTFRNALVQSIAGANTMIFNKKSYDLFCSLNMKENLVSHDWMIYLLVSASGGVIKYSQIPSVLYRQHANNLVGSSQGILKKMKRFIKLIHGEFNQYNVDNMNQLEGVNIFSKKNLKTFELYKKSIFSKKFCRLYYLLKSKVYRQTFSGQIGLYINLFVEKGRNKRITNE